MTKTQSAAIVRLGKNQPDSESIQQALAKILLSRTFAPADRSRRFLEFVVNKHLASDSAALKSSVIAIEVFDKTGEFDQSLNSSVRTAANRLRRLLEVYYRDEGQDDRFHISLPLGRYVPIFTTAAIQENDRKDYVHEIHQWEHNEERIPTEVVVPRANELAALQMYLKRASSGRGCLICVTGEPGIGKTVLIESFLRRCLAENNLVAAAGGCRQELAQVEPYLPWIEILTHLTNRNPETMRLLKAVAPTWWNRLQIQRRDGRLEEASTVKREMQLFLKALTQRSTIVLSVDDLQWADMSTLDLISYLGACLPSMRFMLIASCRPFELILRSSPFVAVKNQLKQHRVCEDLELPGFNFAETQLYLDLRFEGHRFPENTVIFLQERTGGNVLYLSALIDHALEAGWLARDEAGWFVAVDLAHWSKDLPPSIDAMVRQRLSVLSSSDWDLMRVAALQGAEFDSAVVSQALKIDGVTVENALTILSERFRLIRLVGEDQLVVGGLTRRYSFAHSLYREALLPSWGPVQRQRICQALAEALIALHGERGPHVPNIARLFEDGGDVYRALLFYRSAATRAVELSAYRQAFDLAKHAAELAANSSRHNDETARIEMDCLAIQALSASSLEGYGAGEIERIYQRAQHLRRHIRDHAVGATISHIYWAFATVTDLARGSRIATTLLNEASATRSPELIALAKMEKGIALLQLGKCVPSVTLLSEANEQWKVKPRVVTFRNFTLDPRITTTCNLARAEFMTGESRKAREIATTALEFAMECGHERTQAYALAFSADIAHFLSDYPSTLAWANRAVQLASEHQLTFELVWATALQAWVYCQTGEVARAVATFEPFLGWYKGPCAPKFLCHHANALRKGGHLDAARAVLEEASRISAAHHEKYYDAELYGLKGELILSAPRPGAIQIEQAGILFQKATVTSRRQGAKSLELRALSRLANFYDEFRPERASRAKSALQRLIQAMPEDGQAPDLAISAAISS